jgi:hypothetical protein
LGLSKKLAQLVLWFPQVVKKNKMKTNTKTNKKNKQIIVPATVATVQTVKQAHTSVNQSNSTAPALVVSSTSTTNLKKHVAPRKELPPLPPARNRAERSQTLPTNMVAPFAALGSTTNLFATTNEKTAVSQLSLPPAPLMVPKSNSKEGIPAPTNIQTKQPQPTPAQTQTPLSKPTTQPKPLLSPQSSRQRSMTVDVAPTNLSTAPILPPRNTSKQSQQTDSNVGAQKEKAALLDFLNSPDALKLLSEAKNEGNDVNVQKNSKADKKSFRKSILSVFKDKK